MGKPLNDISGHDEFRIAKEGIEIITYTLNKPVDITEYITAQQFYWEKELPSTHIETYSCRFLDLHNIERAIVGDTVTVYITGCGGVVPISIINDWMLQYGTLVDDPRYYIFLFNNCLFFVRAQA